MALTIVVLLARHAIAQQRLQVDAEASFSVAELEHALALRGAELETASRVFVRTVQPGIVAVVVDGKNRDVVIGKLSGTAAARRVALVVLDTLTGKLTVSPIMARPIAAKTDVEAPPAPVLGSVEIRPNARRWSRLRALELIVAGATGTTFGGTLRLVTVQDNRFVASGGVDVMQSSSANARTTHVPLTIGGGFRFVDIKRLSVDMQAQIIAASHKVHAQGNRSWPSRWRFGAGAVAIANVRLAPRWSLSALAQIATYRRRQRYSIDDELVASTRYVDAWVGVGLRRALWAAN